MTRVVILYPNANNNWFDKSYYVNKHIPLVQNCMEPYGLTKIELDTGISGMNEPAPYLAIAYLTFNSIGQFQQGMEAQGETLIDDIPNYTRDYIVQIGETVEMLQPV